MNNQIPTNGREPGTMLDAARSHAALGIQVFPLYGKIPIEQGGFKTATTSKATITEWWSADPDANIGTPTGCHVDPITGLPNATPFDVLDVDVDTGGLESLQALIDQHGVLPDTVQQVTGSGGHHYFFASTGQVRNSAGALGPGLDIRGTGGYVVLAPSIHPETHRPYAWVEGHGLGEGVLAPPPKWLEGQIAEGNRRPDPVPGAPIPKGERETTLMRLAGAMRRQGATVGEIQVAISQANQDRCAPPLDDVDVARMISSVARYNPEDPLITAPLTDVGNAERFAHANRDKARYVEGIGWHAWDGHRWKPRADRLIDRFVMHTVRATHHAAIDLPDSRPDRKPLIDHARRSEHGQRLTAMQQWARPLLLAEVDELDSDRWLFNCATGTLDLRTRKQRPHDPDDLITKVSPVPYNPGATCPTWEAFLRRAMGWDESMVAYLQRVVGIFLTGDVREKFLPIFWGPSDTGKTTCTETILALLGSDYAQVMAEATIAASTKQRSGGDATPDLARLLGVRLAVVSEPSAAMQLNAARVKAMTGRNRITARELHKSQFDFDPTHKILIETNDKPGMRDGDEATFNRVHLIPFTEVIPKDEQDRALPQKFLDELPGILAWAVQGCLEWQAEGHLSRPATVTKATDSYRQESDPLREFLEDRCELRVGERTTVAELYRVYIEWARANSEGYPYGKHRFNSMIEARGISRDVRFWNGISVIRSQFAAMTGRG